MKKTIFGLVFAVAMPMMFAAQTTPPATVGSQAQTPSKSSDNTTKKKSKKGSKKSSKKGSDTTASK
jgi:hypothetical protein